MLIEKPVRRPAAAASEAEQLDNGVVDQVTAISTTLGRALQVASFTGYARTPLGLLLRRFRPAVFLDQILIHLSPDGRPVGFISWAFVSEDTAAQLGADPGRLLHMSEWNEGTILWIVDVAAPFGHLRPMLDAAFRGPLAGRNEVAFSGARRGRRRAMVQMRPAHALRRLASEAAP